MATVFTACNLCEAICGLELTVENGQVIGVRGDKADPLSRGHICPKGVAIGDIHSDPTRLKRPVRRIGTGAEARWEEIGWDEAFDRVADRLASTINQHGRDAVAIYLGNPNVHSLGSMTHGVELARTLRTRNSYSATSVDQLPHQLVSYLMYGHQLLIPIPDIDRTSYFLVFGANPMASNGSLMTVPDFPGRLRELHKRGGRMVVVDPRRTETATHADEHIFIRPGTDAWVLLAMVHTLLADGGSLPDHADGIDALTAAVEPFTPERAAEASGVPAETIVRLARELAAADAGVAYGRMGVLTNEFGTVSQWAIQLLNLLTGNLDREGGAMLTSPAIDIVGKRLIGRGHYGRWTSRVRGLPEFGGELPVSALREEIETLGDGQVRALLTVAGNPVVSTPDGAALERALAGLDFQVAVDIYVNATTQHADVILPPTTALERDHYDLAFHVFAVRNTAKFSRAVLPKGHDQRHDWEIFREVGLRTLARLDKKPSLRRRLEIRARLSLSPRMIITGLLAVGPKESRFLTVRRHPHGVDLGPLRAGHFPRRLQTKSGHIDAAPALVIDDLARLEKQELPQDGELVLIGRRHQRNNNSWMGHIDRLTKGQARHQLLVHPDDLAARGLPDGATLTVTSRVGSIKVEARLTDDVMRGVVSLPHGLAATSINDLTDPERLDISGNAAFSGLPVTIA